MWCVLQAQCVRMLHASSMRSVYMHAMCFMHTVSQQRTTISQQQTTSRQQADNNRQQADNNRKQADNNLELNFGFVV